MDPRVASYPSLAPFADRWISYGTHSANLQAFDSRTRLWRRIFKAILACDLKDKNADILTMVSSAPKLKDSYEIEGSVVNSCSSNALLSLMASPFCLQVQQHLSHILVATMGPVRDLLPFAISIEQLTLNREFIRAFHISLIFWVLILILL